MYYLFNAYSPSGKGFFCEPPTPLRSHRPSVGGGGYGYMYFLEPHNDNNNDMNLYSLFPKVLGRFTKCKSRIIGSKN